MTDTPKVNDQFKDDNGKLHRIEEVTGNAFRITFAGTPAWFMFSACEIYSHGAGTINYWQVKP